MVCKTHQSGKAGFLMNGCRCHSLCGSGKRLEGRFTHDEGDGKKQYIIKSTVIASNAVLLVAIIILKVRRKMLAATSSRRKRRSLSKT